MQLSLEKQLEYNIFCRQIDSIYDISNLQDLLKDMFLISLREKEMFNHMIKGNPQDFKMDINNLLE